MSTMSRVGLGALIAAGGYVGATAWVSAHVKTEFETSTAALTRQLPFAKVLDEHYDKGLFASTRTTKLQLGCMQMPPDKNGQAQARQPIVITWRDHIQNGPLPGFKALGVAAVDTEFIVPEAVQKHLTDVFGKQPPLTIHTLVGWDGSTRTQIASPKASYLYDKEGEMHWSGLSGTITRAAGPNGLSTADVTMPRFEIKRLTGTDHVSVNQAHFHFEGPSNPDNIWINAGKGDGELASIDVQITPTQGGSVGEPLRGVLSNLKYHGENTLSGGLLTSKGTFSGSGKFGDTVVNQILMDVSLKNIHAATYARMLKDMTSKTLSCDESVTESPAQSMQQMQADLPALLVYNPEYSLDRLLVEIDGKQGQMSYTFGVQGATDADKQTPLPALLLDKGYVKGSAKLPLSWLEKLAAEKSGGADGANPSEMVHTVLDQFAAKGYVVLAQDSVSSSFNFTQGKLEVNGHPLALPVMGAPAGGMPPGMPMPH